MKKKTKSKINPKIIRVNSSNLLLDFKNPRLSKDIKSQDELWKHINDEYYLEELALSIHTNGYFEAEPLIAIPYKKEFKSGDEKKYNKYIENKESNKFIIIEGNRRLATIKGLVEDKFEEYKLTASLKKQFENLPALVYPNRNDAIPFLSAHHLIGVRKWDLYERVKYIVQLIEKKKFSVEKVQNIIGDKKNSVRKIYICYNMMEQVKKDDESFRLEEKNFSLLLLATGQGPIRRYLGFHDWDDIKDKNFKRPINPKKIGNLRFLLRCIFDTSDGDKLIRESRDITRRLRFIFENKDSIEILKEHGDIELAYTMSDGEIEGTMGMLKTARKNLEDSSGKLDRLRRDMIKEQKKELSELIEDIYSNTDSMRKEIKKNNKNR